MKICKFCQSENPFDAKICSTCGRAFEPHVELPTGVFFKQGSVLQDRYEIVEPVGTGGMGKVYKALDKKLKAEYVAIKVLSPDIAEDPRAIEDLQNEAKITMKLSHDNIMRLHNYEEASGYKFLVMEYIGGQTLEQLIARRKKLTVGEVVLVAKQICSGLQNAHSKGIIHRDLKPSNLMITQKIHDLDRTPLTTRNCHIKITDFGIARIAKDSKLRLTGQLTTGTLAYMSPEQIKGAEVDGRSDIYSLGCVLYELLNGKPPFHTGDVATQHLNVEPGPLAKNVPEWLQAAVMKCLCKNGDERFSNAEELSKTLKEEIIPEPPVPPKPLDKEQITKPEIPSDKHTTRILLIAGAIVVGVVFALVVVVALMRSATQQEIHVSVELPEPESIRIPEVHPDVEAALKLAYSTALKGEAPVAAIEVMVQPRATASEVWRPLRSGETMSSADNYRIFFKPEEQAYFYVFQIDSTGKLDWLFPRNPCSYSQGTNPVAPGAWTQLPYGDIAYHLDENLGIEHIYTVATRNRWSDLETALGKAYTSVGPRTRIEASFDLRTRGLGGIRPAPYTLPEEIGGTSDNLVQLIEGKKGVLVEERWFRHVAPPSLQNVESQVEKESLSVTSEQISAIAITSPFQSGPLRPVSSPSMTPPVKPASEVMPDSFSSAPSQKEKEDLFQKVVVILTNGEELRGAKLIRERESTIDIQHSGIKFTIERSRIKEIKFAR